MSLFCPGVSNSLGGPATWHIFACTHQIFSMVLHSFRHCRSRGCRGCGVSQPHVGTKMLVFLWLVIKPGNVVERKGARDKGCLLNQADKSKVFDSLKFQS